MLRMLRENALGSDDRNTSIRSGLQPSSTSPPQRETLISPTPQLETQQHPKLHNEGGSTGLETIRGRLAAQREANHVPKPNGCRGCK